MKNLKHKLKILKSRIYNLKSIFKWLTATRRRKILSSILAVLVILTSIRFTFFRPKVVKAEWWDDAWMYRKAVTISNSGTQQTDYQVKITLDTSTLISNNKMQSDCDDIRIVDSGGVNLTHWYASSGNKGCNQSNTAIWVKVPTIPTTDINLYVYYGNLSVSSTSNGEDTFPFFDDFEDGNIDKWETSDAEYNCTTTADTGQYRTGNYSLKHYDNDSSVSCNVSIADSYRPPASDTYTIHFSARSSSSTSDYASQYFIASNETDISAQLIFRRTAQIAYYDGATNDIQSYTANTWYDYELRLDANSDTYDIWINDTKKVTAANFRNVSSDIQYIILSVHSTDTNKTYYYDTIFFRKYAATEPTVGSPATEETGPGPIAYWKFDEGYGQDANDSSNHGNTSQLGATSGSESSDPTWQDESMCISGNCLKFDGTDDYVTVSNTINNVKSVSFWVRPNTTTEYFVDLNGSAYISASSGTVSATGFTSPTYYVNGQAGKTLEANKWQHVVVTTDTALTASAINLGKISSNYLQGFLDEVKFYPYARSSDQVKTDYAGQTPSQGTAASFGPDNSWLSDRLVGYWKMDESGWNGTPDEVSDYSGNASHGTAACEGTCTEPTTSTGKFGNGGEFDGTDDYINAGSGSSLNNLTEFTAAAWVNFDADDSYFLSKYVGSDAGWLFWLDGGSGLRGYVYSDGTDAITISSDTLSQDTWTYITMTYSDSGDRKVKLYIDGEEVSYSAQPQLTGSLGDDSSAPLEIGREFTYYDGTIDEVRIYNRALSSAEVADLYEWAPCPVGWWKMDEHSNGSSAVTRYDSSSNGNNLTDTNTVPSVTGKFGNAGNFTSINTEYLAITDAAQNGLDITGNITLSAWIKPTTESGVHTILSKWNASGTRSYRITQNGPIIEAALSSNGTDDNQAQTANNTVDANTWLHVSAVYNGTNISIYLNGTLASNGSSNPFDYTSNIYNGTGEVRIGTRTTDYFDGVIDDVRIYNYARTPQQIVEDMNAGHPAPGSPVGSAIGHWSFDEGYGDTTYNSGNGGVTYNGNLAGTAQTCPTGADDECPTWTNDGKFGKALDFDTSGATDDYVVISDQAYSLFGGTLSVWFKREGVGIGGDCVTGSYGGSGDQRAPTFDTASGNFVWEFGSLISQDTGVDLTNDVWYHAVLTYDAGFNVKVYLDGVEVDSGTSSDPGDFYDEVHIGHYGNYGTSYFNGKIDEVRIYSSELTADQVKLLYNQGASAVMGAVSTDSSNSPSYSSTSSYCPPGQTTACVGPVAEWSFDENTGQYAQDTSENSNTGTLGSGATADSADPTWIPGKYSSALKFDGSESLINAGNNSSINNLHYDAMTVEAWVRNDGWGESVSGTLGFIASKNDTNGWRIMVRDIYGVEMHVDSGTDALSRSGNDEYTNDGLWHHLTFTYDNDGDRKIYIYIDGSEVNSYHTQNAATGDAVDDSSGNLIIGNNPFGTTTFDGAIDNIRIYDYARTPAQIAWDYNRGGPVGWWKFDECSGTVAHDSSGNDNTGTITIGGSGTQDAVGTCTSGDTGDAWYNGRNGKFNSSLNFDGTDDYITLPSATEIDLTKAQPSISMWFKTSKDYTAQEGSLYSDYNSGATSRIGLVITTSNVINGNFRDSGTDVLSATGTKTVNDGQWHHVVMIKTGETTMDIYLDGILEATGSNASYDNTTMSGGTLPAIGINLEYTNSYLDGQIDEVKIFNYALTPLQVKTEYNNGAVRFGP